MRATTIKHPKTRRAIPHPGVEMLSSDPLFITGAKVWESGTEVLGMEVLGLEVLGLDVLGLDVLEV